MASLYKVPGAPDSGTDAFGFESDVTPYSWFSDQTPGPQSLPANTGLPIPESSADASVMAENTDPAPPAAAAGQGSGTSAAVNGTPDADTFTLDAATVAAAVAPTPMLAQISGYSAA